MGSQKRNSHISMWKKKVWILLVKSGVEMDLRKRNRIWVLKCKLGPTHFVLPQQGSCFLNREVASSALKRFVCVCVRARTCTVAVRILICYFRILDYILLLLQHCVSWNKPLRCSCIVYLHAPVRLRTCTYVEGLSGSNDPGGSRSMFPM